MNLIKPCECGDISRPFLYGDGFARQEVAGPGALSELYFTTFFGYVVECEKCGISTEHFQTPEEAVDAWNRGECKKPEFDEQMNKIKEHLNWFQLTYDQLTDED